MVRYLDIILFIIVINLCIVLTPACDPSQAHNGCKIQAGACTCGFGCKSEFRFRSSRECRNALKVRGMNICSRFPCLHRGTCIQITQEPGFRCKCEGTGYYGDRCERACPTMGYGGVSPYECIVI